MRVGQDGVLFRSEATVAVKRRVLVAVWPNLVADRAAAR